jgi:integrase
MFCLVAATGLRWQEAATPQRRDLALDVIIPTVKVRRAFNRRGAFKSPKSRYGRREVPLTHGLADALRVHVAELDAKGACLPSQRGTPLSKERARGPLPTTTPGFHGTEGVAGSSPAPGSSY